ncbi:MAG TPA: M28 family peptidase [Candidatus Methylomirabilis sp.]|nr:M28 family peptidase [Candidatus Methylomirabilis sp.]
MTPDTTASQDRLLAHLQALVGTRDPYEHFQALEAAADYVAGEFAGCGLAVSEEPVVWDGRRFRNIVGTRRGITAPEEQVLVVAHYDTKPGTPGADDNASAVAAMLETARLLTSKAWKRTLQFVGFTLEEYGYQGSCRFAQQARQEGRQIVGVLDLEMVGFTSPRQRLPPGIRARRTGDFIGVVGNRKSRGLVDAFAESARRSVPSLPVESLVVTWSGRLLPIVRLSDHAPFWDAGFPAVMITDTAFLRNPHYHEPSDTLETLDLPFLTQVTTATAATAAHLALPMANSAASIQDSSLPR